jgi:hypothetical protein
MLVAEEAAHIKAEQQDLAELVVVGQAVLSQVDTLAVQELQI